MAKHTLKSWSAFFQAIKSGEKPYDLRDMSDREFAIGDVLTLQEYDPFAGTYTGEQLDAKVTYITSRNTPCALSSLALDKNCCILGLRVLPSEVNPT
jgi:hypothetical protein